MGLHLHQAMLIKGILQPGIGSRKVMLNVGPGRFLLVKFTQKHEHELSSNLHLEAATCPKRFVITSRSLNYLHDIFKSQVKN